MAIFRSIIRLSLVARAPQLSPSSSLQDSELIITFLPFPLYSFIVNLIFSSSQPPLPFNRQRRVFEKIRTTEEFITVYLFNFLYIPEILLGLPSLYSGSRYHSGVFIRLKFSSITPKTSPLTPFSQPFQYLLVKSFFGLI